jgi:TonB-linked SusC/RagA family outer membrane protein|tara:strand:- start:7292 stop:10387 length:3096 start_codon:yes stop_codon:yes gene_type:complete
MKNTSNLKLKTFGSCTKRVLLFISLIILGFKGHGQNLKVNGTVLSEESGQPIPGVSIVIKGSSIGTSTDFDGLYTINVAKGETLVFSYLGMEEIEIIVSTASNNVLMKESVTGLDEIVVVGYGTVKKRELTGAIASVKAKDLNKTITSDFASAIQGRIAGVSVRQGNAAPGENATITIRGITSFQDGGSGPLYVVDGVTYIENPNITPQEIESIEVLKDGASAAIYGSRASGGVILITTKKGKEGQMKVNLDSYYGVQHITSGLPLANTLESLYINDIQYRYDAINFDPLLQITDGLENDTNWLNLLQVDAAPIQNHSLSLSGGKNGLTYNVTGTFFDQTGSFINSKYKKHSLRSNTGFKKGKFTAQTNLSVNFSDQQREPYGLIYNAIRLQPYMAPIDFNSDIYDIDLENIDNNTGRITNFAGTLKQESSNKTNSFNGNIQLGYEIIEGLSFRANIGRTYYNKKDRWFRPSFIVNNNLGEINNTVSNLNAQLKLGDATSTRSIDEFIVNYNKSFNKHNFKFLIGNTYESSKYEFYRTGADNITSNLTPVLGNGEPIVGTQTINKTESVSYLGRINYNYNWKYLLSLVVRRDGSSNFGNNKYGTFPSISAGWALSNEKFFKSLKNTISMAKIRFGYGTTGSDRVPPYGYSPVVISNVDYPFGEDPNLSIGLTQPGYADPNLKWESNISKNLGLDLTFKGGKAGLEIDLYEQDKKDMLLAIVTPISAGSTPVNGETYDRFLTNIGNLRNRGIEISAHYNHKFGPLSAKFSGNFTKNENKVVSLSREGEIVFDGYPNIIRAAQTEPVAVLEAGLPVGAFKVYETNGTIKTDEELIAYQLLNPNAQKGDLRYVDSDGNGELDANDKVYKGSYQPDFEVGFNIDATYKDFDFSVQFYGVSGNTIYNGQKQYAYSTKRHRDLIYSWTDMNPTSNIPTPRSNIEHPNVQTSSDYFLEDGSFLRLRNIILGYSLKTTLLDKIGIEKLRLFINAQNPITWTKYSGFDPEVGSNNPFEGGLDRGSYPVSSTYSAGISIIF